MAFIDKTVKFLGQECKVEMSRYSDDLQRDAILLFCPNGELMTVATVNIPEAMLQDGEVWIKPWSENTGVYEALVEAGIVGKAVGTYPCGFSKALRCPLLVKNPEPIHEEG